MAFIYIARRLYVQVTSLEQTFQSSILEKRIFSIAIQQCQRRGYGKIISIFFKHINMGLFALSLCKFLGMRFFVLNLYKFLGLYHLWYLHVYKLLGIDINSLIFMQSALHLCKFHDIYANLFAFMQISWKICRFLFNDNSVFSLLLHRRFCMPAIYQIIANVQ